LVSVVSLAPTRAFAQHGPTDQDANATAENVRKAQSIARQTMSPFCPGRTLADCPSEYAAEWRHDIQQMVNAGRSASEIQAELERRAGGDLSGNPNRRVGYALPVALVAGALLILFGVFRYLSGKKKEETVPAESAALALAEGGAADRKALEARLEKELDEELAAEEEDEG
jgi:cytochrome c-type biogenesis protein CcmH/NrfF